MYFNLIGTFQHQHHYIHGSIKQALGDNREALKFWNHYKVVSDNGTSFSSHEFKDFMDNNGIVHTRVVPYHPSSNGQAESAVQIVK